MKPAHLHLLMLLGTALVAGTAGWFLGRQGSEARIRELEAAGPRAVRERALEDAARGAGTASAVPSPTDPAAGAAPQLTSPAPAGAEAASAAPDAEARLRRVREIGASVEAAFERGAGNDVLGLLKELAALAPEGREAAMELAIKLNSDVSGPNQLGLSTVTFYTSLSDPAIRDLMVWAFANPSPTDFRVMSAYSLVWTMPPAKTIELYAAALDGEKEPAVQRAMIENLAFLRDPAAMKVLTDTFLDPTRDPALRAIAAAQIATVEDPGIEIALQNAARGDPDERVREASAIALVIRNPPVSGYMVTGTLPDSQAFAAGMKSGDILVSYGGRPVRTLEDLRAAAGSTAGEEKVSVVVVRDGREVTVDLRPGRMGIYGREVQAAADR